MLTFTLACGCTDGADDDPPLGPSAPIEILVDSSGVPHIFAQTDADAFFGAGYRMASDRLFQLDNVRRRALGRWAEVHGPAAVADDELARIFDFQAGGRADFDRLRIEAPETADVLTAWVAGIDRRIREVLAGEVPLPWGFGPDELDYAPELWEPEDSLVVSKMIMFANDLTLDREILATIAQQYFPETSASAELIQPARASFSMPPDERPTTNARLRAPGSTAGDTAAATRAHTIPARLGAAGRWDALGRLRVMGSNNLAIAGRHTDNGRPIVAGDPHIGMDFPGMMYLLHLNSRDAGGSLDVAGFTLPGMPGVSLGHTDRVAWTATTCFSDTMDMWDVPVSADAVTLGGVEHAIVPRSETILVRGAGVPVGRGEPHVLEVLDVPGIGVLLPDDLSPIPVASAGRQILLAWTGFEPGVGRGMMALQRARSVAEFEAAVGELPAMGFNWIAADANGVTYRVGQRVPDRGAPREEQAPYRVLDGTDPQTLWTGESLPPERMPHSHGGERGWVVTANNDPFGFTTGGRVDDDPWYYGAFFAPGWRAGRLEDELARLATRGSITAAEVEGLLTDSHENMADEVLPLLRAATARIETDESLAEFRGRPDLARLVRLLDEEWDGSLRRDQSGAVVFHAYEHLLATELLADDFPVLFEAVLDLQPVFMLKVALLAVRRSAGGDDPLVQGGLDASLLRALAATAEFLVEHFGTVEPEAYRFADAKVTSVRDGFGRGLDLGSFPSDGGETTVNVSPSRFLDEGRIASPWVSRYGPLERTVTTFAEDGTPEARVNFPAGNVADPESSHFDDFREDWVEGRYRRLLFRRAEVEANLEESILVE